MHHTLFPFKSFVHRGMFVSLVVIFLAAYGDPYQEEVDQAELLLEVDLVLCVVPTEPWCQEAS